MLLQKQIYMGKGKKTEAKNTTPVMYYSLSWFLCQPPAEPVPQLRHDVSGFFQPGQAGVKAPAPLHCQPGTPRGTQHPRRTEQAVRKHRKVPG